VRYDCRYPTAPPGTYMVRSQLATAYGTDMCAQYHGTVVPPDSCCLPNQYTGTWQPLASFDLSPLGLVPPFHVVEGP